MSLDQAQSWNGRTFYVGAARAQGATTIALRDGQGAQLQAAVTAAGGQTVSSSHPLRFSVVARAAINPQTRQILDYSRRAGYTATGISGDSLTGVALVTGTDQAWEPNDLVASERDAAWENAVTSAAAGASGALAAANNLSDLANASTARANLGLGTAATYAATAFADATATAAALADKLSTMGNGSGLTGLTQSQIAGLHADQSPTFAGATFTGATSAPAYGLSGATAASSFGTAVLDGRSVPVINADGSVNVAAFDSAGMTINGSSRPNVIGAALSVTPVSPSHVGLTVNGAPSQTADILQLKDSSGTTQHKVGPDGRTYWGNNDLGGTFNVFAGGSRGLAVFQWQEAFSGGAVVASYVGNPVTGVVYGYLASGVVSDRFFNRIQNTGDGSAVFDAAVYGAGSAYTAYGKNGGSAWCSGYHQADGDSFKIGAYGLIGYDTVLKITPTGGTSLAALAAGTVPLTARCYTGATADTLRCEDSTGSANFRVNKNQCPINKVNSAPADGDLGNGDCAEWFDAVSGRVCWKAKTAGGTVVTGYHQLT